VRLRTLRLRASRPLLAAAGGDADQVQAAREVLTEAERVGDHLGMGLASLALAEACTATGAVSDALDAVDRALTALGDDVRTVDWRMLLLYDRLAKLGDLDRLAEGDVVVRELVETAERHAVPHRLAASRCGAAEHHYQLGRWDEALAELETLANSTFPVTPIHRLLLHGLWALVTAHRDEDTTAAAHISAVADHPITAGMAADHAQHLLTARAVLAERLGQPAQARDILAGMLEPARIWGRRNRRQWLPDLTRLAIATGDLDTARAATAAAAADAVAEATLGRTAAAEHCRGLLEGDPATLLAAAATQRGIGRPFELAKVLEDAAVLLARHGELPAARAAFGEAVELYTGLRAEWDLLRADSRLRPHGIRRIQRRRRRPATGWDALTPTELKVAYRVAEGDSNAQVAGRMLLSLRTVEIHVSHILAKLGARSRVEIARHAADHPAAVDDSARPHASAG
jgi:DNA-binding CsgD family transcriptional regulator